MGAAPSKKQVKVDSIAASYPVFIGFLGSFYLLKAGQPLSVSYGGKIEVLLSCLAFQHKYILPREKLLETVWPDSGYKKAVQSLNSLIYYLHNLLGDMLGGKAPVVHEAGYYWLNVKAGIGIDIVCFDAFADEGDQKAAQGEIDMAIVTYRRAISLYHGDIQSGSDIKMVLERERLRDRYINLLEKLTNHYYALGEYLNCIDSARDILARDPCREETHRLIMRCFMHLGQRAQALRQYRLCQEILRAEFDAIPEAATTELYDQLRRHPENLLISFEKSDDGVSFISD